jgi:putative flippase GtrA
MELIRLRSCARCRRQWTIVRTLVREALGYAAVSVCAFLLDVTVLWTLVKYCNWWYLAAATASFLSGAVVAYFLSVRFVFTQHRLSDRRAEFASFAAIGCLGLAINATVIFLAVNRLGLHVVVAKFIAAGLTLICNFVSRRQLLFVASPTN